MIPPLKERVKQWICKVFGHRKEYSHTYAGKNHFYCKRCKYMISEELEEWVTTNLKTKTMLSVTSRT